MRAQTSTHTEISKNKMNNTTLSPKMTSAIICKPLNWYGRLKRRMEVMPVPMLTENQLGAKFSIRRRHSCLMALIDRVMLRVAE